jgi:hypothetical protein
MPLKGIGGKQEACATASALSADRVQCRYSSTHTGHWQWLAGGSLLVNCHYYELGVLAVRPHAMGGSQDTGDYEYHYKVGLKVWRMSWNCCAIASISMGIAF